MTRRRDGVIVKWRVNGERKQAVVARIVEAHDLWREQPGASHFEVEYRLSDGYHMHWGFDERWRMCEMCLMRWTKDGKLVRRKERAK